MLPVSRGWKLGGTTDDGTSVYLPPPPVTPPGNSARSTTPPGRPVTPPIPIRLNNPSPPVRPPPPPAQATLGVHGGRFLLPRLPLETLRPPSPPASRLPLPTKAAPLEFSFERFAISVLPEARVRPTAAVQTLLRKFTATSTREGDRWRVRFDEFKRLIGNEKVEISDFRAAAALTTAPQEALELREFALGVISLAPKTEASLVQKLTFGFGLYDWKETGAISGHQLMCLLNGLLLKHGPCKAGDLEMRRKAVMGADGSIRLEKLVRTANEHPEYFEKDELVVPPVSTRRSSGESEYKRLTAALERFDVGRTEGMGEVKTVGKPRIVQFHTDYHNVKMNKVIGRKKNFFNFQAKSAVLILTLIGITVTIFVLRSVFSTGAAISALLDALGAFSGFAAFVMIGTLCLKSSLDAEDTNTDHDDLEEGHTPDP